MKNNFKKQPETPTFSFAADTYVRQLRLTVTHWTETFVYGRTAGENGDEATVQYARKDSPFNALEAQLYEGAQLNVLSARLLEGVYHPAYLVLDPDYLLDVSMLSVCLQPYGSHPFNYLLKKFLPRPASEAILLGNAANQFIDDCVNELAEEPAPTEKQLYFRSIRKHFRNELLAYAVQSIAPSFFSQTEEQFRHIRHTVKTEFARESVAIPQDQIQLEPSFLCEAMGLRGRMDVLTLDGKRLVELKSGRDDEWRRAPREEHRAQVALYQAALYYNLGLSPDQTRAFLFYSRYPRLYEEKPSHAEISRLFALRNGIVHLERLLRRDGIRPLLPQLTVGTFNERQRDDRFFHTYLEPELKRFVASFGTASPLELAYFDAYLRFVQREHHLAYVDREATGNSRAMANLWRGDAALKRQNGDMIAPLRMRLDNPAGRVERLRLELTDAVDCQPNFRVGDYALLYERNTDADTVASKQVFRGVVEDWQSDHLVFRLHYPQRNAAVFRAESLYALEHDGMDIAFTQSYRGLYAFLEAPVDRRELLLGLRPPRFDTRRALQGEYHNAEITDIVRQAVQADDYFLLVGPPGTGKTRLALRSMVEEFLRARRAGDNLLLLAYTHRAVDEICDTLESIGAPSCPYVRLGNETNVGEKYRQRLLPNIFSTEMLRHADVVKRLAAMPVVVSTIATLGGNTGLFRLKRFHTAIIDEASQALEPQLLPLLCAHEDGRLAIERFIFIGDPRQLPAVVVQPAECSRVDDPQLHRIGLTNCRNALFERLYALQQQRGWAGASAMLCRTGRMHEMLTGFISRQFYQGRLTAVPLAHQQGATDFAAEEYDAWRRFVATTRMGFVAVEKGSADGSVDRVNVAEACRIVETVQTLFALCERNGLPFAAAERIGIIVPFRAQITQIRRRLAQLSLPDTDAITVDTVECFQGSQRDVILFGATVSQPCQLDILSQLQTVDGEPIDRKLNVALTRSRKQLFLFGSPALLATLPPYAAYIRAAACFPKKKEA